MHSIQLDINDTIFDKVMFFLNNMPSNEIKIKELENHTPSTNSTLVDFFQKSPLLNQLDLTRDTQEYSTNRVEF